MNIFARAVISGFGFSLGAALFKKVSDKLGLGESKSSSAAEASPDPNLTRSEQAEPEDAR
jgi:hypothetical protein